MKVKIYPHPLQGEVNVPSSKSLTHRALIVASLANGDSIIKSPLYANDTYATINCLRALGVEIKENKDYLKVKGVKRYQVNSILDAEESASTLRFLIPLIAIWNNHFYFKASLRLIERIKTSDLATLDGLKFTYHNDQIEIEGTMAKSLSLNDEITSQWISGVIMSLPITKGLLKVNKLNNPYINLTLQLLNYSGINLKITDNVLTYKTGSYQPLNINIEGDLSTAAFYLTMAIFNQVKVTGINQDSHQGDIAIFDFFKKMQLSWYDDDGIYFEAKRPISANLNLSLNPDLAPIIASLASVSKGTCVLQGLEKLEYKESNRLVAIYEALKALGADINLLENKLFITGKEFLTGGVEINGYNDHRIIMSLVAISSRVQKPFIITDSEAVKKSNPDFFRQFQNLGGIYEYQI